MNALRSRWIHSFNELDSFGQPKKDPPVLRILRLNHNQQALRLLGNCLPRRGFALLRRSDEPGVVGPQTNEPHGRSHVHRSGSGPCTSRPNSSRNLVWKPQSLFFNSLFSAFSCPPRQQVANPTPTVPGAHTQNGNCQAAIVCAAGQLEIRGHRTQRIDKTHVRK